MLATQLRAHRKAAHLSQAALAQQLYVSRQTISNWENGKSLPDIYSLIALSDLFEISLDDFIKGDVRMQKRLDTDQQLAPLFAAGTIFVSFLTVMNNGPMSEPFSQRLRMGLIIGQLLFSVFLLYKGKNYAHSFIDRRGNGRKIKLDWFSTWLMYYLTVFNTVVTVAFGLWALTG
ncbi:helix-turn-helix transcriptional regulator [Lactiplantibacillus sp. WILCCON 0030]|uniref:Helix-turn-helix transcriptional regulator n=1 Tax=Lactiplantibacillus brownii TaxID=3069269 RepID=A0ABU1A607_9LACO|nr:helix-turn-helix transcriptional regulator [Lactiplantibacillus brownii]MDQ7936135.1 helix-turn-helix transcriptional regulator [Lactiplantibacillus brownii]